MQQNNSPGRTSHWECMLPSYEEARYRRTFPLGDTGRVTH
jgi:hypothetical protein